jgi:hypothetical protein
MYHLLEVDDFADPGPYRTRYTEPERRLRKTAWIGGQSMSLELKEPLRFELWEYQPGRNGLSEIFLDTVPLFREDLLAALTGAGVDNLETCPAILEDPLKKRVLRNYRAVNIVGAIRCADLGRSQYHDMGGTGLIAMGFRKLVIDEARTGGALMFRLAESPICIVVHDRIREAIESKSLRYPQFRSLGPGTEGSEG